MAMTQKTVTINGEEITLPICGSDGEPVKVALIGLDGNAHSIMGRVAKAMRRAGVNREVVDAYCAESMKGDYDHLLATAMEWVEENSGGGDDEGWDD